MLVTKMAKQLRTSESCHQHISSPTSVTNIDATAGSFKAMISHRKSFFFEIELFEIRFFHLIISIF